MMQTNQILTRVELENKQAELRLRIENLLEKQGSCAANLMARINAEILETARELQFVNLELENYPVEVDAELERFKQRIKASKNWQPIGIEPVRFWMREYDEKY